MSPPADAARTLESLVADGHTVRELERTLGLSHGYLSKIRHGAATASPQLVALLEVLRLHPSALGTVRAATGADVVVQAAPRTPARPRDGSLASRTLRLLAPAFTAAGVRWAVGGDEALRLRCPAVDPASLGSAGVDVVVEAHDRHVLEVLRSAGYAIAHHPPTLAICRLATSQPNENLRFHFPTHPPLAGAVEGATELDGLPVLDLTTVTLAHLLSRRTGAERSASVGIASGVSVAALRARLAELDAWPEPKSPYVMRTFDRAAARGRLAAHA